MKRLALVLTLLCLLALGGQAFAELCTIDAVPAATLLLPYFEVDLAAAPGTGVDTLFSINNASAAPTIAHVSVWTDWTQPVLDFDIYLTGYDVQSVSLYQAFVFGNLPVTADEQSDQGPGNAGPGPLSTCTDDIDTCSPSGDGSGFPPLDFLCDTVPQPWDCSFDGTGILVDGVEDCIAIFPFFSNPLLVDTIIDPRLSTIQAKLTGEPIDGTCYGASYGDDIARGYITIDNADACSLIFPNDPGYFSDGVEAGLASNVNQLWGDWFLVDPANAFAEGDTLVHVEAEDGFVGGDNDYTYYRRYSSIDGSLDNREPLATTWGVRYLNGVPFDGTSLTVWRDATIVDIRDGGFACGAPGVLGIGPSWHPLNETQVVAFDEAESWEELCSPFFGPGGPPVSPPVDPDLNDPVCFPLETQRVATGVDPLELTYPFGWMYLNLNVGLDAPRVGEPGVDYDSTPETLAQSYVQANHSALGLYSVGYPATALTSACLAADISLFE